jgi:hypothetical protein
MKAAAGLGLTRVNEVLERTIVVRFDATVSLVLFWFLLMKARQRRSRASATDGWRAPAHSLRPANSSMRRAQIFDCASASAENHSV